LHNAPCIKGIKPSVCDVTDKPNRYASEVDNINNNNNSSGFRLSGTGIRPLNLCTLVSNVDFETELVQSA